MKEFIIPWLEDASNHPFSLVKVNMCEDMKGVLIINCDVRLTRNHIDDEV